MKTHTLQIAILLSLCCAGHLHAQGSLTPPAGPPAPVMKTLQEVWDKAAAVETQNTNQTNQLTNIQTALGTVETQNTNQTTQLTNIQTAVGMVEARIPVNATTCPGSATAVHVIGQSGSYYLTGQVAAAAGKSGIVINAAGVVLDLNGFNINAFAGSTKGILVTAALGPIVIRNGLIRNSPQGGIQFTNAVEFTIEDITIINVTGRGIDALGSGTIARVTVNGAKDYGIYCSGTGQSVVRDCRVENVTSTGQAMGIYASNGKITGCAVSIVTSAGSSFVRGIYATDGDVESCSVTSISNTGSGSAIGIDQANRAANCRVSSITAAVGSPSIGIQAEQTFDSFVHTVPLGAGIRGSSVARNLVHSCQTGIYLDAYTNTASGNAVIGCSNYGIYIYTGNATVTGNQVTGDYFTSGSKGISSYGSQFVRIESNSVSRWTTGIETGSDALVVRNSAGWNTTNFNIGANMPIATTASLGTNPNANISH